MFENIDKVLTTVWNFMDFKFTPVCVINKVDS